MSVITLSTLTVNEHDDVFPAISVAVHVTVLTPKLNLTPESDVPLLGIAPAPDTV